MVLVPFSIHQLLLNLHDVSHAGSLIELLKKLLDCLIIPLDLAFDLKRISI